MHSYILFLIVVSVLLSTFCLYYILLIVSMLWKTASHKKLLYPRTLYYQGYSMWIVWLIASLSSFAHSFSSFPFLSLSKFDNNTTPYEEDFNCSVSITHYENQKEEVHCSSFFFFFFLLFFMHCPHVITRLCQTIRCSRESVVWTTHYIHNKQTSMAVDSQFARKISVDLSQPDFGICFRLRNVIVLVGVIFISFHVVSVYERLDAFLQIRRLKKRRCSW